MKANLFVLPLLFLSSCITTSSNTPSSSVGTVGKGKLINGKKIKYRGNNFHYFSYTSYHILRRGYLNNKVKNIVVNTYKKMEQLEPNKKFVIMECSNKYGGKVLPHRTHQNGLSVDFMVPLIEVKTGKQYTKKGHIGIWHYLLSFDQEGFLNNGKKNIKIDFEAIAKHILTLQEEAKKENMKIQKVLLKINLKDNLFATKTGKKLKESGIYFAKYLTPKIDNLHDDHYHIDFQFE